MKKVTVVVSMDIPDDDDPITFRDAVEEIFLDDFSAGTLYDYGIVPEDQDFVVEVKLLEE